VQEELQTVFPDFKVSVQQGKGQFTLTKQHGDETIYVEVNACSPETMTRGDTEHVDLQNEEEEEEREIEDVDIVSLAIRVSKPGKPVDLLLTAAVAMDEQPSLEIVSAQMVKPGASLIEIGTSGVYEGPTFADLDANLQRGFEFFLADRGFDERFAEAVRDLSDMKEEGEYLNWLQQVHHFVDGPAVPEVQQS
jgi:complement component 1 Q subcomponent-binding protein